MQNLPPLVRAPLLGFGLGAVAGGFEAVAIGAKGKLSMTLLEAMVTGIGAVGLNGALGVLLGVVSGLVVSRLAGPHSRHHAVGMGLTGFGLAAWFMGHLALDLWTQQRFPAALAFALMPVGAAGVVYFNAGYWLRREDLGERRRLGWWFWSLVFALGLSAGGAFLSTNRAGARGIALDTDPNIVVITIDTLRRDHISIYGEAPHPTPTFERIAQDGVVFLDAITPFPETAPAHAALFTGLHPARNGVLSNGHTLSPGHQTLAEIFESEGYNTAAFVSSFALDAGVGLDQGFQTYDDDFFPHVRALSKILVAKAALQGLMRILDPQEFSFFLERPGVQTVTRALRWVDDHADRPFLLWVHTFEPHAPYDGAVDHRHIMANEPGYTYNDAEREGLVDQYATEVLRADADLDTLLVGLKDLERPLILVVVGDHGEMLGEHGLHFHHHGIWEETLRVPLVIVPHKLRAKTRVVPQQVRLMDVPATLLDLVELEPMKHSEGVDLLSYAEGRRDKDLVALIMGRRTGRWADGLVCGYRTGQLKLMGGQLFDLYTDREEGNDISPAQPEIVETLAAKVQRESKGLCDAAPSGEITEGLKALGYLE